MGGGQFVGVFVPDTTVHEGTVRQDCPINSPIVDLSYLRRCKRRIFVVFQFVLSVMSTCTRKFALICADSNRSKGDSVSDLILHNSRLNYVFRGGSVSFYTAVELMIVAIRPFKCIAGRAMSA